MGAQIIPSKGSPNVPPSFARRIAFFDVIDKS